MFLVLRVKPISVSEISEYDLKYALNLSLRIISRIGLEQNQGNSLFVTLVQYPKHEVML